MWLVFGGKVKIMMRTWEKGTVALGFLSGWSFWLCSAVQYGERSGEKGHPSAVLPPQPPPWSKKSAYHLTHLQVTKQVFKICNKGAQPVPLAAVPVDVKLYSTAWNPGPNGFFEKRKMLKVPDFHWDVTRMFWSLPSQPSLPTTDTSAAYLGASHFTVHIRCP